MAPELAAITLAVTVTVTFVTMRLRVTWLDDEANTALAPLIDRYAFIAALAVGVVAWFAFRRSFAACALCLVGLAASTIDSVWLAISATARTSLLLFARLLAMYRRSRQPVPA